MNKPLEEMTDSELLQFGQTIRKATEARRKKEREVELCLAPGEETFALRSLGLNEPTEFRVKLLALSERGGDDLNFLCQACELPLAMICAPVTNGSVTYLRLRCPNANCFAEWSVNFAQQDNRTVVRAHAVVVVKHVPPPRTKIMDLKRDLKGVTVGAEIVEGAGW